MHTLTLIEPLFRVTHFRVYLSKSLQLYSPFYKKEVKKLVNGHNVTWHHPGFESGTAWQRGTQTIACDRKASTAWSRHSRCQGIRIISSQFFMEVFRCLKAACVSLTFQPSPTFHAQPSPVSSTVLHSRVTVWTPQVSRVSVYEPATPMSVFRAPPPPFAQKCSSLNDKKLNIFKLRYHLSRLPLVFLSACVCSMAAVTQKLCYLGFYCSDKWNIEKRGRAIFCPP